MPPAGPLASQPSSVGQGQTLLSPSAAWDLMMLQFITAITEVNRYPQWLNLKQKTPLDLQFNSVQLLGYVRLFAAPWTATHQASLSITNSQSLPKLVSIELVMPSNHLILCYHLLLLPWIFPSIRVFSNESALLIMWPKYWNFSISPSNWP